MGLKNMLGGGKGKFVIWGLVLGGGALVASHFIRNKQRVNAAYSHAYSAHDLAPNMPGYIPEDPRAHLGWRAGHDPGHDTTADTGVLLNRMPTTHSRIAPPPSINFHVIPLTGSFNKQTNGFTSYF